MGVPAFYKFLVTKYPDIVVKAFEETEQDINISSPNPNGIEFHNLYLDMNGIIHPCFHPDDHPSPPKTFDEVFTNIYKYIDHIFSIVRPRKLLYLAIDGVAPRAKMNQQRTRRFRNAKDTEIAEAEEERLRKEYEIQGKQLLPKQESEVSDSNIISPGTEFMSALSRKLQDYVISNMNTYPAWNDIKVILSDASVPGEGEHKIMSFIRQQRTLPGYDPNTRHCLYGLDADLIMLALATHELHFSILREDVRLQQPQSHTLANDTSFIKRPHQFLHVWILRDYLELDMFIPDPPDNFTSDIERIIDDFIFMCFFAGNDFIPNLPTLQIHELALDLLMTVYKKNFKKLGGYLVDMQRVNSQKNDYLELKRVERFILMIGTYEEMIFKKRSELRQLILKKLCQRSDALEEDATELDWNLKQDMLNNSFSALDTNTSEDMILQNTKEFKEELSARLKQKCDLFQNDGLGTDKVKLGTPGWKKRYYEQKFFAETPGDIEIIRKEMVARYTEGLLWVLGYYFSAVPSWSWFYPYHYAPFASDMKGMAQVKVKFEKGSPFKPLDQLMGVLPPRSGHALPKSYHQLMIDEHSSIIDFYPTKFQIDTDGKRFTWQGVLKLPFIDEERLLAETKKMEKHLKKHEADRNVEKVDKLFVRRESFSESFMLRLTSMLAAGRPKDMVEIENNSSGIGGYVGLYTDDIYEVDSTIEQIWNEIQKRNVLGLLFELPKGSQHHIPRPLMGVKFPEKTISHDAIAETQLWHERCLGRNRLQVPDSQGNSYHRRDYGLRLCAENAYSELKHDGGRGRARTDSSFDYYQHGNYSRKSDFRSSSEAIHKVAGPVHTGWSAARGRGRGVTSVENVPRFVLSGSTSVGGSGQCDRTCDRTMYDELANGLKLSESSHSIVQHGKSVSGNNSFWPSRSYLQYQNQTNNAWRQGSQPNVNSGVNPSSMNNIRQAPGTGRENH